MILKEHVRQGRLILAICDDALLGNKIDDGKTILDLTSGFYKGERTTAETLSSLIKKAYIINAVGKDTISFLKKVKIISEKDEFFVLGVPHIQVVYDARR